MMTLDEAIEHAEWCVENSCGECADDHKQLAEWLRELKELLATVESLSSFYGDKYREQNEAILKFKRENAKLRDLVRRMRYGATWTREYIEAKMRELGIEVDK